jgi:hypothetical protein
MKEREGGNQWVGGLLLLGGMMGREAPVERVEGRTVVEGGLGVDVGDERETVNAWGVLLSCLKRNVK